MKYLKEAVQEKKKIEQGISTCSFENLKDIIREKVRKSFKSAL